MAPKVLIMRKFAWAEEDCKEILSGIADVVYMESQNREELFKDLGEGGKYNDIVAAFYEHSSKPLIGYPDKDLINALPKSFKWLAYKGAGYDPVDVHAAKARGIMVSNTPGAVDEATATTALYLLLNTMRGYTAAEKHLRQGGFAPVPGMEASGRDLSGKSVGILGMGGIGLQFANMLQPFGMKVSYHNRNPSKLAPENVTYEKDLYEMLGKVDILSIHMPLSEKTKKFIGEKEIRSMKKGSIIINTARGGVIDEEALIAALKDGHLATVGLDVFTAEPKVDPRLIAMEHITLLPHIGTENRDARRKMEVVALNNIKGFLTEGKGPNLVPECE